MLSAGPALRVILHLNEDVGSQTDYLYNEVIRFLYENGVAGATVIRPSAGFGSHHQLHRRGSFDIEGSHLPVVIEFVENKEKAQSLLPQLCEMVTDGMVEAHETTVLKVTRRQEETKTPKDESGK